MPTSIANILNESGHDVRRRLFAVYAVLIGGNILIWLWALVVLDARPVLLGTALLAYTFGLRHAVDADHIAAIDNVTRKLMQQGQRPVGVGFFFSLGHAAVVVLMSVGVAFARRRSLRVSNPSRRSAASSARASRRSSSSPSRSSISSS
jgi:nickel/cobalt transporter (NiCoT) family protein